MARQKKSRILAAILAFLFGGFGIHKFYLGKPGEGFFYVFLLLMVVNVLKFPITTLLGFFDAFRLLTMSEESFDKKYNKGVQSKQQSRRRVQNTSRRRDTSPAPRRRNTNQPTRRSNTNFSKSNPFKKSGITKYKDFDLDGAIADFEQGLAISENDVALHWNIANAYSLTEKKDKAFYHLDRAIELGFNDFEKIQNKDDLAFLRIQPEFDDFKANGYQLGSRTQRTSSESPKQIASPVRENDLTDDILLSQLNKLAELRKKGLLSEQEFVTERKKLLRR